jgi:protein TonB
MLLLESERRLHSWRRGALVVSVALHALAIALLIRRPQPPVLNGSASLRGVGGRGRITMLVSPGVVKYSGKTNGDDTLRVVRRGKIRPAPAPAPQQAASDANLRPGMPGFILGSVASGWALDHDVHVAVPVDAPDPPIARSKLPEWMRGDVIVEVTIDDKGNVVATNVLHTIGFGIDEIIVATVRNWHYLPARVDGMPVASREDVHFHFPS